MINILWIRCSRLVEKLRLTHYLAFMMYFIVSFLLLWPHYVQAQPESFTYYGFIPSDIRERPEGFLWVTGNYDGTHCQLYNLSDNKILKEFTVNRMELKAFTLPSGTLFKIVSNKPVTVIIKGRAKLGNFNADATTNYPSVEGTYVGKEFIFTANTGVAGHVPYRIFSLEETTVKITGADGSVLKEAKLPANGFLSFSPKNGTVYHVESTGYIEVASFNWQESYFVPAATGGFVGKIFYGSGTKDLTMYRPLYVFSVLGAKVKVFDLGAGKWAEEFEVPPKGSVILDTRNFVKATTGTTAYVLIADKPVTVQYLSILRVEEEDMRWKGEFP